MPTECAALRVGWEEKERYKQAKVTDVAINSAGSDFVPAAGPAGTMKEPLGAGSAWLLGRR